MTAKLRKHRGHPEDSKKACQADSTPIPTIITPWDCFRSWCGGRGNADGPLIDGSNVTGTDPTTPLLPVAAAATRPSHWGNYTPHCTPGR